MGKVFLIDVPDEYGVKGLIGDAKMLKFQFNGACLGEFPLPYNTFSMQEVDVISLLVSGDSSVEVGYNIAENFSKKNAVRSLSEIMNLIHKANGLVFMGRREQPNTFVQYIYAFLRGVLSPNTEL